MNNLISKIRSEFIYDPESGFVIKKSLYRRVGWKNQNGYREVKVDGKTFKEHRVIFVLMNGEWPPEDVDHINGVKDDNRWKNLRQVSTSVNMQNQKQAHKCNASGMLGVTLNHGKWRARIRINKKEIYLGNFCDKESAYEAYLKAKKRLHEGSTLEKTNG